MAYMNYSTIDPGDDPAKKLDTRIDAKRKHITELREGVGGVHVEADDTVGDTAVRSDDEQVAQVARRVRRPIRAPDLYTDVAAEEERKARLTRPVE